MLAANPALGRMVAHPPEGMTGVSLIRATATTTSPPWRVSAHPSLASCTSQVARVSSPAPSVSSLRCSAARHARAPRRGRERAACGADARSDLVANLSHELRTPIAGARAIAETLQGGPTSDEERARFLGLLVDELERMSSLIQRMLRLAQIESEREPIALETLAPRELLDSAAARFEAVARQRGVAIEVGAASGDPVLANRERSGEVLANLVENALRLSPSGATIELAAAADGDAVRFEVRDEGPGIMPQERERIFERFYTGDRAREAGSSTGLGLAIARLARSSRQGRAESGSPIARPARRSASPSLARAKRHLGSSPPAAKRRRRGLAQRSPVRAG